MSGEKRDLICSHSEEQDIWYCVDPITNDTYKLTDYDTLDVTEDLLLTVFDGGYRDLQVLTEMLSKFDYTDGDIYRDILSDIEDCAKLNGSGNLPFYCVLDGIKNGAEAMILEYTENEFCGEKGIDDEMCDEFKDWLEESLNDTYLDYNYIAWGCGEESEEGMCNLLESTMMNAKVPENQLEKIFQRWKEEYGDIYED